MKKSGGRHRCSGGGPAPIAIRHRFGSSERETARVKNFLRKLQASMRTEAVERITSNPRIEGRALRAGDHQKRR
jgi:hypothetical protein